MWLVWKAALGLSFAAILSFGGASSGQAQELQLLPPSQPAEAQPQDLSPAQRKMQPLIRGAVAWLKDSAINPSGARRQPAASRPSNPLLRVDSRARVQLYLKLSDAGAATIAALEAAAQVQIELVNQDLKMVQAWVPYDQIEAVAALDFVEAVRAPDYAVLRTGSVTTQGDAILKTDTVRNTLGYTGAGVKVGVISSGANNASASQATGDLPASFATFGGCDSTTSGCDEGTAMMEIIYDVAPGAALAMADAATSLDFLQRIADLTAWGAKVIVDDVGFLGEPYFEDGPMAEAYSNAVAQGIVMVSAAGNQATGHYQGMFVDSNGSGFHDFGNGSGEVTLSFSLPAQEAGAFFLQWSDPFGAAADNYDLCILNSGGITVIGCSTNLQSGTQDPIEAIAVSCLNPTASCLGTVRIQKVSGAAQTLELYIVGATQTQFVVARDSIFGHAAAPGVISVGASGASDPGNLDIEPYSSQGPSTISFPAPQQRPTPTITAVDCVSVTGAGGFPSPFCGTSAAAPHIAAIVALMLQAKPSLTPAQVETLLENSAADRGIPGFDNIYGAGLADGLDAVLAALGNLPPTITSLSPASATQGGTGFTLTVNGSNFASGSTVQWNGAARPTTFVSANQLTAAITASDIALGGSAEVTVFAPAPGGGTSSSVSFSIADAAPTLASLSPPEIPLGETAFALTAHGSNFSPNSVVRWNGADRPTTFVSATQVDGLIAASDVATAGTVQITVFSPAPGGGVSSAIPLTILPVPTFTGASLVNGASFTGVPPAAGGIASLFGTYLASAEMHADGLPLKTTLGTTTVRLNNIPAPLFFVSSTQINFQVPWELAGVPQTTLSLSVETDGGFNALGTVTITLSAAAPGIFSTNSQGTGQGAILISNTATFAAPTGSIPGSDARPASRGEFITIYCTGLGTVSNPPASGAPAGSNPTSMTIATPTVMIGGVPATPSFSGLSPGFVGLYQVDVPVPANAPTGDAIPVTLSISNVPANTVTIAVQ